MHLAFLSSTAMTSLVSLATMSEGIERCMIVVVSDKVTSTDSSTRAGAANAPMPDFAIALEPIFMEAPVISLCLLIEEEPIIYTIQ